tara:strand:+ start:687 stop:1292 length:606 start_codon:yes stop_codon:yes gene_type:complete
MAVVGQIVPEGQQSKEGFHALRRTTEGMLYYTKIDKDNTDTIDVQGGNPSDLNGTEQLPQSYTEADVEFSSVQYFAGDGTDVTFDITNPPLDSTRFKVFVNNIEQKAGEHFTYSSPTITFKIKPSNGAQIAVGIINKKYNNNTNDKYNQYLFEEGDATFFVDSDGYFVKRENRSRGATALTSDDFSTFDSSSTVASTTWRS